MAKIVNKYPVGIQTFEKIRENGYLYIDKTKYIVDFREKQMSYVFLSRQDDSASRSLPLPFRLILREERNFSRDWPLLIMRKIG